MNTEESNDETSISVKLLMSSFRNTNEREEANSRMSVTSKETSRKLKIRAMECKSHLQSFSFVVREKWVTPFTQGDPLHPSYPRLLFLVFIQSTVKPRYSAPIYNEIPPMERYHASCSAFLVYIQRSTDTAFFLRALRIEMFQ